MKPVSAARIILVTAVLIPASARALHAQAARSPIEMQEVVPAPSPDALVNPGMGLYLFGTLDPGAMPAGAWYAGLINIGYFRDDWSKLEPDAQGKYRFDEYFGPIFDLWVRRWHKRVAFRFMSANMHSHEKYVTPKWVFDSGVPGVPHRGIYAPEQVDPVFWDDRYLTIQEKFIADLGKYLDGRPGLEFIDIGGIGEWGEMHLARWTSQELEQTGYTRARYITAYRRLINAYARAFPHTRVFLNVGDYAAINDYAAIRHVNFRQDGLTPSGPSDDVGKRFYAAYSRCGVVCNYELYAGYQEMKQKGWGIRETLAKGLEDPISYLHINLMGYDELLHAPAEVKDAVTDAALRIGFRFRLSRLRCSRALRVDGTDPSRLLVESTWKNVGVAPCYNSYALRWDLLDAGGRAVAQILDYPDIPTTRWWPGEEVTVRSVLSAPPGLGPGTYHLKVAMVEPSEPGRPIQLDLAPRDADGRYDLCTLPAERVAAASPAVYEEGFERGTGGWTAAPGMEVTVDRQAHTGNRSLLATGTQPGNAWNYAAVDLPAPVLPASRYRLSCWMKVDRIDAGAHAPYLKIGLNDAAGRWLTNVQTNPYDTSKSGIWQFLSTSVETTPDTAAGQLAIEKGGFEDRVSVTLRLDDVRLELLERP